MVHDLHLKLVLLSTAFFGSLYSLQSIPLNYDFGNYKDHSALESTVPGQHSSVSSPLFNLTGKQESTDNSLADSSALGIAYHGIKRLGGSRLSSKNLAPSSNDGLSRNKTKIPFSELFPSSNSQNKIPTHLSQRFPSDANGPHNNPRIVPGYKTSGDEMMYQPLPPLMVPDKNMHNSDPSIPDGKLSNVNYPRIGGYHGRVTSFRPWKSASNVHHHHYYGKGGKGKGGGMGMGGDDGGRGGGNGMMGGGMDMGGGDQIPGPLPIGPLPLPFPPALGKSGHMLDYILSRGIFYGPLVALLGIIPLTIILGYFLPRIFGSQGNGTGSSGGGSNNGGAGLPGNLGKAFGDGSLENIPEFLVKVLSSLDHKKYENSTDTSKILFKSSKVKSKKH